LLSSFQTAAAPRGDIIPDMIRSLIPRRTIMGEKSPKNIKKAKKQQDVKKAAATNKAPVQK
jgi:hypothetical protein